MSKSHPLITKHDSPTKKLVNTWKKTELIFKKHQFKILILFCVVSLALISHQGSKFFTLMEETKELEQQSPPIINIKDTQIYLPEPSLSEAEDSKIITTQFHNKNYLIGEANQVTNDWGRKQSTAKAMSLLLKKKDIDSLLHLKRRFPQALEDPAAKDLPLTQLNHKLRSAQIEEQKKILEYLNSLEKHELNSIFNNDIEKAHRIRARIGRPSPTHLPRLCIDLPGKLLAAYLNNIHVLCSNIEGSTELLHRVLGIEALKTRMAGQYYLRTTPTSRIPYQKANHLANHWMILRLMGDSLKNMLDELQSSISIAEENQKKWLLKCYGTPFTNSLKKFQSTTITDEELISLFELMPHTLQYFWARTLIKNFKDKHSIQNLSADFYDNRIMNCLKQELSLSDFEYRLLSHYGWTERLKAFDYDNAIPYLEEIMSSIHATPALGYMTHEISLSIEEEKKIFNDPDLYWDNFNKHFNMAYNLPLPYLKYRYPDSWEMIIKERPGGENEWENLDQLDILNFYVYWSKNAWTGIKRSRYKKLARSWARNRGLSYHNFNP